MQVNRTAIWDSAADYFGSSMYNFMSSLTAEEVAISQDLGSTSVASNIGGTMICKSSCGPGYHGACREVRAARVGSQAWP